MNTGIISKSEIIHLRKPCKNRGVELIDNNDGTATINGNKFDRGRDVEAFLESIPRNDISNNSVRRHDKLKIND